MIVDFRWLGSAHRTATRTAQSIGTCSSSGCTLGSHVGLVSLPVSIAIEADQSSLRLLLIATCRTKLDHGALVVGYGSVIVTGLDFPTFHL